MPPAENHSEVERLVTEDDVASLVRFPTVQLKAIRHKTASEYQTFHIPKRRGGTRTIQAPTPVLMAIQSRLSRFLSSIWKPRASSHGYLPRRSIVTNAAPHAGKSLILNVDLSDFFGFVTSGRVYGALKASPFNFGPAAASLVSDLCCLHKRIPQGAPSSPVLSNIVCWRLDRDMERLAKAYRCTYSRYADDMTFSTTATSFSSELVKIIDTRTLRCVAGDSLERVIKTNGFAVNARKFRIADRSRRQEVTGLVVNSSRPNVKRSFLRDIRAELHDWHSRGPIEAAKRHFGPRFTDRSPQVFEEVVRGQIGFVGQIRGQGDDTYLRLLARWSKLAGKSQPTQTQSLSELKDIAGSALWVIGCEETGLQGSAFYMKDLGLVTCAHVLGPQSRAYNPSTNEAADFKIVALDRLVDLAVLELKGTRAENRAFEMADVSRLSRLDKVFVLGFPRYEDGATFAVRPGVVSGFKDYHKDRRILVNAEIEAGMSGGPVLDSSLKVIGIAKTGADTAGGLGDGYEHGAIPIDRALALKVVRVNSSDLTALLTKHRLAATTDDADVDNTVPLDNPVATWRSIQSSDWWRVAKTWRRLSRR
jgi:RNA-directed DNA polymerase